MNNIELKTFDIKDEKGLNDVMDAFTSYENEIKEELEKVKEYKQQIVDEFVKYGKKKIETEKYLITLVSGREAEVVDKFNEKKFKEENEMLHFAYTEKVEKKATKSFIKITERKK